MWKIKKRLEKLQDVKIDLEDVNFAKNCDSIKMTLNVCSCCGCSDVHLIKFEANDFDLFQDNYFEEFKKWFCLSCNEFVEVEEKELDYKELKKIHFVESENLQRACFDEIYLLEKDYLERIEQRDWD